MKMKSIIVGDISSGSQVLENSMCHAVQIEYVLCTLYNLQTSASAPFFVVELDRYIGNTHHRGRLWDNRNHRKMMTIGGQSVPMFHDDVTHRIRLAMGSIGHPCRTIQGSARHLPLMTVQALREASFCDEARPKTHAALFKI